MQLYLQMGHGMMALSEEMIKKWGSGSVIISPVNMNQDRLASYAKKINSYGGEVLFDPQMFYPKEGHDKLKEYEYWPEAGVSVSTDNGYKTINQGLLRINNTINSAAIILPGKEMSESDFAYGLQWMRISSGYFRGKTTKPLYGTLCLYPETIRNPESIELLVEAVRSIDVDGYYLIPHPSNNEYIVADPLWTIGMMKLISCLKLHKRKVIVGYTNHQGLLYSLAHVDGIASGTFMNTRSFVPSKFKSPKENDVKHKSTWYYLPQAMCEYRVSTLDIAAQRGFLTEFAPAPGFENTYSSMLFKGGIPSNTNYNETQSFRHYLHCVKQQCALLSCQSYKETYDAYEFMLHSSESVTTLMKRKGIGGQNRDFVPAIEANRIAACATNEDYGFRLEMEWSSM